MSGATRSHSSRKQGGAENYKPALDSQLALFYCMVRAGVFAPCSARYSPARGYWSKRKTGAIQ